MWVFTRKGFLSIVQHRTNASLVIVRSQSPEAIESFLGQTIKEVPVRHQPRSEYPYQATVPRPAAVQAMFDAVEAIDYQHFKASVKDNHYQSQCLNVWAEMQGLYEDDNFELEELNQICATFDAQVKNKEQQKGVH